MIIIKNGICLAAGLTKARMAKLLLGEKWKKKPACGFIRLLEIGAEEIKLSFEHGEMKWIGEDEIDDKIYCWKKMPEMIKKGFALYKKIK